MLMLRTFAPLFLFMLLPVWIPMLGVLAGAIADRLAPRRISPAQAVVADAKARTARRLSTVSG